MSSALSGSVIWTDMYPRFTQVSIGPGFFVGLMCLTFPLAVLSRFTLFFALAAASVYAVSLLCLIGGLNLNARRLAAGMPAFLLFALMWLSLLWSDYPEETFFRAQVAMGFLCLFTLALLAFQRGSFRWFFRTCIILPYICLGAFMAVLALFGSIRVASPTQADAVGSFSNLAPALALLCLPFLIYLFRGGGGSRLAVGGSMVSVIAVTLLSQSRGAYLMLGVTLVLIVLLFGRGVNVKAASAIKLLFVAGFALLIIVVAGGYENTFGAVAERFQASQILDLDSTATAGEADYSRQAMYLGGIETIRDEPLTGIGYGGLAERMNDAYGFRLASHNLILTAWGEMGLLGLLLFIWLTSATVSRAWESRRQSEFYRAALVAVIVALLHAQIRPQLENPMFWVVLAVALAAPIRLRLKSPKKVA